jgi:small subunit ribosomal protein S9
MSYIHAIGRRKTSVARVYLRENGTGEHLVNAKPLSEYFKTEVQKLIVFQPFGALGLNPATFDLRINANGGGTTGQAEAIRLGIARALELINKEENRPPLKRLKLLTRDSRKVERKKYGHKKARRSFQFSKR